MLNQTASVASLALLRLGTSGSGMSMKMEYFSMHWNGIARGLRLMGNHDASVATIL